LNPAVCLISFAWDAHPDYRFVLAANRDESHQRPSQDMHWWPGGQDILAGRDLQAGGTWLAMSRSGRFATVTNYREGQRKRAGLESRGELVTAFVAGDELPADFVAGIDGERYAGFNLLAADESGLWYVSNRGDGPLQLGAGVYGLSNASLDTPWAKLVRTREKLAEMLESGSIDETRLMRLLADRTMAAAADVDQGDLPFELARAITAPFIVSEDYGTRCTTILTWNRGGDVSITERRFDAGGRQSGESRFSFRPDVIQAGA
jgi:uncharacterized protein with NRDE domain